MELLWNLHAESKQPTAKDTHNQRAANKIGCNYGSAHVVESKQYEYQITNCVTNCIPIGEIIPTRHFTFAF